MEYEFSLSTIIKRSIRDWWILAVTGILGAAIGWIIFTAKTPIYQAEGVISIGIDFTRTGQLSDIEEDQMIGIVGDILYSPDVIANVVEGAGEKQIYLDAGGFKQITKIERRQNQWNLIVRHTDPATAKEIAELWTQTSYSALVTSMAHSERASHLQRYLDALESCLQKVSSSNAATGLCGISTLKDLQKELENTGKLMVEEKTAAQGMLSGTTITLARLPEQPSVPILFRQGEMILVGCLGGLLAGILGMTTGWTDRLHRNGKL